MELLKESALRMSLQISLSNCVTPGLRQVNVIFVEKRIRLNFYYDNLKEEEEELPDEVETELWGIYYGEAEISTHIFILKFPIPIPQEGLCVYCRAGEVNPLFDQRGKNLENELNSHLLISYATQIALLGCVTPNLRKLLLKEEDETLLLDFYYDSITEQEKELPLIITNRTQSFFTKKQIVMHTTILPFPLPMPTGSVLYARYEKYANDR